MPTFHAVVTALALLLAPVPADPAPPSGPVVREVPVLMYHVIGDPPDGAAWPHLFVSPSNFAEQVEWLAEQGFRAVTLSDVWSNWREHQRLPPRPVVITFDDGHRSIRSDALPILSRRGWPAVLNLKVGNVEPGSFTDADVDSLVEAGWELGAHTFTHPDLRNLADAALEHEVAGSRAEIARRFGVRVDFFCYPAGRYDARVIAAVRRAGFLGATTTAEGLATSARPFALKRIRISRGDGVSGLANALPARSAASPGSAPRERASGNRG